MKTNFPISKDAQEWIVAVILFVMTNPFFLWFAPLNTIAVMLFYGVSLSYSAPIKKKYRTGFLLLTIFYFLVAIRYGLELSMIYTMAVPIAFLIDKSFLCRCFDKFIKIFAVLITISLVVYVMVAILQMNLPCSHINPINSLKAEEGVYYDRYFMLLIDPAERGFLTRFYGIYDEPGVVGTICSVILVGNKFDFKKNKYLIPTFLAGFFSFSLFFYVLLIVGIFFNIRKSNIIYVLISIPIVLYALSFIPGVDILIYNRFLFEDGVWLGDSRSSNDYKAWFERFIYTADVWFGLGPGANLLYNKGGASYKDLIVNYGILMFIMYILSLFILIIRTKSTLRDIIVASVIIFGYVFQRPFITDVFMVLSIMYVLFNNEKVNTISSTVDKQYGLQIIK